MIKLGMMKWSNMFSYGENNYVDFSYQPLTQVIGMNGHGKSSIGLILEEILYNKNSKGIKKAAIINRNSNAKTYTASLEFSNDVANYLVSIERGTTSTISLLRNGENISSHTATGTYSLLEQILGLDHKTFSQIIYQSSATSLEFLTTTDSNRKKFLIDLLALGRYIEPADRIKSDIKELENEIIKLSAKVESAESWLKQYTQADLSEKALLEIPAEPKELQDELAKCQSDLITVEQQNKAIIQNNKYCEILSGLIVETIGPKPQTSINAYSTQAIEANAVAQDSEKFIRSMKQLGTHCLTCKQKVDTDAVDQMIKEARERKFSAELERDSLQTKIAHETKLLAAWEKKQQDKLKYEEYHSLYNPKLPKTLLDKNDLAQQVKDISAKIAAVKDTITAARLKNTTITTHNARIAVIQEQKANFQLDITAYKAEIYKLTSRLANLQILSKTFSPSGLVAYKIECLVKDLEEATNKYLGDLSAGRFQLFFKIAQADKLNVIINDNGTDITIEALSGGERARVNTAALLGIRKLLQSLSNSRINLLFLDETIDNLDIDGKEKLVEVLLAEDTLNTFIVSHGFNHPLLERLHVVKEHDISRIDYGS